MKTITEFSGFIIQRAAQARAKQTPAAPVVAEAPAAEAAPAVEAAAPEGGEPAASSEDAPAAEAAASEDAPAEDAPAAPRTLTADDEQLGTELDVSGDRLVRLVEALEAVGDKSADVRLVRVFAAGETVPKGGRKIGEHVYVIDYMPKNMSQTQSKSDRGGFGGKGGGRGGPGGGRPGGGGPGGAGGKAGGGFGFGRGARDDEPRGPMPSSGVGWTLSRGRGSRR